MHLEDRFEGEPFRRLLGIRLLSLESGYACVEMKVERSMLNIFEYAHGGAIFSLIDAAFELASNSSHFRSVALNVNVSYLKPAKEGDLLRAEAREVNSTRKTAFYQIEVKNQRGELVATCSALAYRI